MKAGWQTSSLGDVLETIKNGLNCKQDKSGVGQKISRIESISLASFDLSRVGYAEISDSDKSKFKLIKGDILFSHINSPIHVGKTAAFDADEDVYHGVNLLLMRPVAAVKSAYLEFFLKYLFDTGYWRKTCKQSVNQASVNQQDISRVPFSYPADLKEQQRIITLLDEAFNGITTAKAHAEKNLQNARAIFESHLESVFAQRGDGWVSTTIDESCTLKSGTTVPVSIEKSSGDIPYLKVAEMTLPQNQDGITTSIRFLDRPDTKSGWLIPKGSVIFPKRGGAILTNKKRLVLVDMCADLNIMSVIPSKNITPDFLYFYFLTVDMRELGTGSSIPQINNYDIAPLAISFPKTLSKQTEITEAIRSLQSECKALESIYQQKLTALDELKKSLLYRAFNGDL